LGNPSADSLHDPPASLFGRQQRPTDGPAAINLARTQGERQVYLSGHSPTHPDQGGTTNLIFTGRIPVAKQFVHEKDFLHERLVNTASHHKNNDVVGSHLECGIWETLGNALR
jgi:hypothetical protein